MPKRNIFHADENLRDFGSIQEPAMAGDFPFIHSAPYICGIAAINVFVLFVERYLFHKFAMSCEKVLCRA